MTWYEILKLSPNRQKLEIWYYTIHKHGYDEFNEQRHKEIKGTLSSAIEMAEEDIDSYDIRALDHKLYGGTGFFIKDENGKVIYDSQEAAGNVWRNQG
tara:strand:+ start:409 stop:702 length:294 start_codon:yes stop_codon:yes gene_type:complete